MRSIITPSYAESDNLQPMTILSFLAVFAGLGLSSTGSYEDSIALVFGIFVGSAL